MFTSKISERFHVEEAVYIKNEDTGMEQLVVQFVVVIETELGSVQSYTTVIDRDIYEANKKDIRQAYSAFKGRVSSKAEELGVEVL